MIAGAEDGGILTAPSMCVDLWPAAAAFVERAAGARKPPGLRGRTLPPPAAGTALLQVGIVLMPVSYTTDCTWHACFPPG